METLFFHHLWIMGASEQMKNPTQMCTNSWILTVTPVTATRFTLGLNNSTGDNSKSGFGTKISRPSLSLSDPI